MIYTDFVIRISLSMLLGFLIGLERQLKSNVLEGIVGQVLAIPQVVNAGWEVL